MGTASLTTPDDVLRNEITVFKDRMRIDVMTSAPGLDFDRAWSDRQTMSYREQEFYVVSRQDLIASKKAAGRDVDLEEVRLLELAERPGG